MESRLDAEPPLSRRNALRRIMTGGFGSTLGPAGFVAETPSTWIRKTPELAHVVALVGPRRMRHVQWGLVCPEAVPYLHGTPASGRDVSEAIVTGFPSDIHWPAACPSFALPEEVPASDVDRIVESLSVDLRRVEQHLRPLTTRDQLRRYLLENSEPKDRRFVIPSSWPLKIFTAAVLAVIDRDPQAHELAGAAETAMAPFAGGITDERLARLKAGLATIDA